jgi:DNA invertase Pin-like site-specific DNA recombinase
MTRVALYALEEPGRDDVARLDRQVRRLAAQVARRPGWWPAATYADRWPSARTDRPGLARLLADVGFGSFDLVALDGIARLAPDRSTREALLSRLASVGVGVVDLRSSGARRFAAVVADLALADLIGEAAR